MDGSSSPGLSRLCWETAVKHDTLRLDAEWNKFKMSDDGGGAGNRVAWEVSEGFGFPMRKVRASPALRDKEETGHVQDRKTVVATLSSPLGSPQKLWLSTSHLCRLT